VLQENSFDEVKFREALSLFQGELYLKNLVKVDNREPDPLGYVRKVDSIRVLESFEEQ